MLHLYFISAAPADDGLFDRTGRIFRHRQAQGNGRAHRRTTSLAQLQGRTGIVAHEYAFNRYFSRLMFLDQLAETGKNNTQALREFAFTCLDNAMLDRHRPVTVNFDDAKPVNLEPGSIPRMRIWFQA